MSDKRVVDRPESSRFEVLLDEELAGWIDYHREDGALALTHTVVEPRFEGQGVGSALAAGALDAARTDGAAVLPYCPFIRSYIQRHPDYGDLVPSDRRSEFAAPLRD